VEKEKSAEVMSQVAADENVSDLGNRSLAKGSGKTEEDRKYNDQMIVDECAMLGIILEPVEANVMPRFSLPLA